MIVIFAGVSITRAKVVVLIVSCRVVWSGLGEQVISNGNSCHKYSKGRGSRVRVWERYRVRIYLWVYHCQIIPKNTPRILASFGHTLPLLDLNPKAFTGYHTTTCSSVLPDLLCSDMHGDVPYMPYMMRVLLKANNISSMCFIRIPPFPSRSGYQVL